MSKRMLIVDDEPTARWTLGRYFTLCGYSVFSASTLQEALDILRSTRLHVVVTDLMLNGIRGEEGLRLAAHVRETQPDTRVIVLAEHSSPQLAWEARMAAVDLLLARPQRLTTIALHVATLASLASVPA
ncbi:response regulator [Pyxidicoccus sp. 3LFB2]